MSTQTFDLTAARPFGDSYNDGKVQLSFSLPVPVGEEAVEAAKILIKKMGLHDPLIAHCKDLGEGFTFFVAYAVCKESVDYTAIDIPKAQIDVLSKSEIGNLIETKIHHDISIVGACTGTDAHTLGIDAILNMKGIDGHKGLESFSGFQVTNLGAQIPNEILVAKAIEQKAHAILVSQIVTQKNVHVTNLTALIDLLEAEGLRDSIIVIVGGPRITHELAMELGFDAGFGPGTHALHVASFITQQLAR